MIQINGRIMINVDVSVKKNPCEKDYVCNPTTCNCENGKYLESSMKNYLRRNYRRKRNEF